MNQKYENNHYLVSQLKTGDTKAYNHVVKTYHNAIFAYAFSLTNDYATTQDIIQNVFLKTWEFRTKLNPIYPIKSFLYKTTYNEFVNVYHKNQSVSKLEQTFIEALENITSD